MDPRLQALADVLVAYCVAVKPGDWAVVQSPLAGEPLADACVRAILRAGGNPTVLLSSEEISESILTLAPEDVLARVSPISELVYERADVLIVIRAPSNTQSVSEVDPKRMAIQSAAMEGIGATLMSRTAAGALRWTATQFPTKAAAQDAGMSLRSYEDFVYDACLLSDGQPASAWQRLGERQQRLVDWLSGREEVKIAGPRIDLTLNVRGRTWVNDDGHLNFPGGEVFTGPVEDSVQGTVTFSFPAFHGGRQVTGVRLVYRDGRVVDASAVSDGEYLQEMLGLDEGARHLGEFAFGTNAGVQRFTKNTLFDEKIGGTLHMALGRSIPMTGGLNQSALHWDMVFDLRDGTDVTVDGQLFSRNGVFQVPMD